MIELQSSSAHFVRCLKPNTLKQKNHFDYKFVMTQIRYLGIIESVRVRKVGFPNRMKYEDFYSKYHELDPFNRRIPYYKHKQMDSDMQGLTKEMINRVIKDFDKKNVLFGLKKLFFKTEGMARLDNKLNEWFKVKNIKASTLQKQYKVMKTR